MSTYHFTRKLAADIVFAEVRHFVEHIGLHGYTEEDVQSLTRAIGYRIDADVKWTDVDELIQKRLELLSVQDGVHPMVDEFVNNQPSLVVRVFADLCYDIWVMVARVPERWESTDHKALAA